MTARRGRISLDGEWSFKIDPDKLGIARGWFDGCAFPGRISVPGSWNAQGAGGAGEKLTGRHAGWGWYRKNFSRPRDLDGQRLFLIFEGIHRSGVLWVNGKEIGRKTGYVTPWRLDITDSLSEGENTLTVLVDSVPDGKTDRMRGTFDVIDFMELDWGGLYGHVYLELTPENRIENIWVRTDTQTGSVTAEIGVHMDPSAYTPLRLEYRLLDQSGRAVVEGTEECAESSLTLSAEAVGPKLWSPDSPALYTLSCVLRDAAGTADRLDARFGFRSFTVEGGEFICNGKPFFVRGYGDDSIYPLSLCAPADKEEILPLMRRAKDFGFNAIRLHSAMPSQAYLDAADEAGLWVQPELPVAGEDVLKNLNRPARELFVSQWRDYIIAARNHPCVMAYGMGNELYDGFYFERELYDIAKRLDPGRPVIGSDGTVGINGVDVYDMDRETLDYISSILAQQYILPYGPDKDILKTEPYQKPVIVHEMGNYCGVPDVRDKAKFTGAVRPYWLEKSDEMAGNPLYWRYLENSWQLQWICHKINIEAARAAGNIKGYHFWTIVDYYATTQGLMNMFWEDKGITPAMLRQINRDDALLWDSGSRCLRAGADAQIKFLLSRYGAAAWPAGPASIRATVRDRSGAALAEAETAFQGEMNYGVNVLPELNMRIPPVGSPQKARLCASLTANGAEAASNDWDVWLFPQAGKYDAEGRIYADKSVGHFCENAAGSLEDAETALFDELDGKKLRWLENGGKAVYFPAPGAFSHTLDRNCFKLAWWKPEEMQFHCSSNRKVSNYMRDCAVWGNFPHGTFADLQMYESLHLIEGVMTDSLPGAEPYLYDLTSDLVKISFVFSLGLGAGSLLVCTLRHGETDCQTHAEIAWLFSEMIKSIRVFRHTGGICPRETLRKWIQPRED